MNNLEILKTELINQKTILESKNYNVAVANQNPSPSEITASLKTILENNEEVATYSNYYKTIIDPATSNNVITDIIIPDGTVDIKDYFVASLGEYLTGTINMPSTVSSVGIYAFYKTNITDINFSPNLTKIGNYAFANCTSLKKIIMPDTVSSLGSYSFFLASDITELHISENVPSIGMSTFKTLNLLTSITIPASVTSISGNNFYIIPLVENVYVKGSNTTFSSSSAFATHNELLKIWVNFDVMYTYSRSTNLAHVVDHLISEVTIEDTSFPLINVDLNWFATVEDATNGVNILTEPTTTGTYYCKVVV